jgi:hypothetical protein
MPSKPVEISIALKLGAFIDVLAVGVNVLAIDHLSGHFDDALNLFDGKRSHILLLHRLDHGLDIPELDLLVLGGSKETTSR